jgi:hypothetical protein
LGDETKHNSIFNVMELSILLKSDMELSHLMKAATNAFQRKDYLNSRKYIIDDELAVKERGTT